MSRSNSSGFGSASPARQLYDGWNLPVEAEMHAESGDAPAGVTGPFVRRSYVWGTDISGTWQDAGGVSDLLAVRRHERGTKPSAFYWTAWDLTGNILGLHTSSSTVVASYEYDAFGRLLRESEIEEDLNPFRFGTKYTDAETGFAYYGYRFYDSTRGRWLNRDPLGDIALRQMQMQTLGSAAFGELIARKLTADEREQLYSPYGEDVDWTSTFIPSVESGLYRFAANNSISMIDILGLLEYTNLQGHYPNYDVYPTAITAPSSIWKFIGGKVQLNGEAGTFTNSCAIRMSHALNASGVEISSSSGAVSSGKNPPKWWYLYRVEDMKSFLQTRFGAPTVFTSAEFKENCRKGIVVFEIQFADATGHVTLWDGLTTIDGSDNDIDLSRRILFWELDDN